MNAMLALCVKDLRLLVRDRMGFFFALFFPLLMSVFFGTVFASGGPSDENGDAKKIGVIVVDSDGTPASARFAKQLADAEEFSVKSEASIETATEVIRKGKGFVAAVNITKGYGEASERMFWGEPPVLEVYTDPSRKAEIGMFQGLLTKYAFMRMQDMFSEPQKFIPSTREALAQLNDDAEIDPRSKSALQTFLPNLEQFLGAMPSTAVKDGAATGEEKTTGMGGWEPVKITANEVRAEGTKGPPNAYSISFPQGIMWGVLGCSLAMALSLVTERTRGTMIRLRMAPVSRSAMLGGKALTCFVLIIGMSAMLLVIGLMFGVRPVSPVMLAVVVACVGACFTGIMMLIASVCRTEAAAGGMGWAVMLIFSMIGGGMIPLFFMPGWLQAISNVSPVKWGILAIEGSVWRGFSAAEMMTPCAVLVGVGVVCFVIGVRVMKRTEGA